ncbi:hypothetical protein B0H19DRAFT_1145277 [Mycena capillaripes]|nr:hypothetical protein B0H19DRAFT_1145277 [Mycena capillaripes]
MDGKASLQTLPHPNKASHFKSRRLRDFGGIIVLLLWVATRCIRFDSLVMTSQHTGVTHCNFRAMIPIRRFQPWPIPSDISLQHCAEWSEMLESGPVEHLPYSANVTFELPLSADALFLISRSVGPFGVYSKGSTSLCIMVLRTT